MCESKFSQNLTKRRQRIVNAEKQCFSFNEVALGRLFARYLLYHSIINTEIKKTQERNVNKKITKTDKS